jgi:hypothetical protein
MLKQMAHTNTTTFQGVKCFIFENILLIQIKFGKGKVCV